MGDCVDSQGRVVRVSNSKPFEVSKPGGDVPIVTFVAQPATVSASGGPWLDLRGYIHRTKADACAADERIMGAVMSAADLASRELTGPSAAHRQVTPPGDPSRIRLGGDINGPSSLHGVHASPTDPGRIRLDGEQLVATEYNEMKWAQHPGIINQPVASPETGRKRWSDPTLVADGNACPPESDLARANRLADECGKLATERDQLLIENAKLRRAGERKR